MAKVAYETIVERGDFNFNETKRVIKELNDSGLLPKKINVIGKKEDVIKRFLDAVEKIPEEDVAKIPDAIFKMNDNFVDILDKVKPKGGKKKTEKKPKEKTERGPSAMSVIRAEVTKNSKISLDKLKEKIVSAGLNIPKDISMKMETRKTLKLLNTEG